MLNFCRIHNADEQRYIGRVARMRLRNDEQTLLCLTTPSCAINVSKNTHKTHISVGDRRADHKFNFIFFPPRRWFFWAQESGRPTRQRGKKMCFNTWLRRRFDCVLIRFLLCLSIVWTLMCSAWLLCRVRSSRLKLIYIKMREFSI